MSTENNTKKDGTAKVIANVLLNLPADTRAWVIENVAPETFSRWIKQMINGVITRKDLLLKIKRIKDGEEAFSSYAVLVEGSKP